MPFQDAAFRQTIAQTRREARHNRLLVAVCIFPYKVHLTRGMSPVDQKVQFFFPKDIAVCTLRLYYTNSEPYFHGKKAANSLEFTAFLRN